MLSRTFHILVSEEKSTSNSIIYTDEFTWHKALDFLEVQEHYVKIRTSFQVGRRRPGSGGKHGIATNFSHGTRIRMIQHTASLSLDPFTLQLPGLFPTHSTMKSENSIFDVLNASQPAYKYRKTFKQFPHVNVAKNLSIFTSHISNILKDFADPGKELKGKMDELAEQIHTAKAKNHA